MKRKLEEPTRTREHGTRVTKPVSPSERIAAFRKIIEEHQYAKIDGQMIDGFSASAVIQVYDALNPGNQAKFSRFLAPVMCHIAFGVLKKAGGK